jgi:drug/metabolite transporter (DMT)-like permease
MPALFRDYRFAFFLTCAAACWGIATVISKRAVEEIAPLALLPLQLTASVLVLTLMITITRARTGRGMCSPGIGRLALLGVLNPGISYALSLLGLARITASLSVLLWALEPLLILALAWWILRDRITRASLLAMAAAFAGVILIVFQSGAGGDVTGVALTVAGVGACAVYTVICRKLLADDSALTIVLAQQASALVFAIALYGVALLARWDTSITDISTGAWISAIASGLLYYAVAFWFYLSGLRQVGAATAGVFINLIPVVGISAAYLLLGERLTAREWLGAGIVLTAVTGAAVLRANPHTTHPSEHQAT